VVEDSDFEDVEVEAGKLNSDASLRIQFSLCSPQSHCMNASV
jgi:hypothetical protein